MAYELRDGQGSIFPNNKKSEKHPDFRGEMKIDGVVYEVSAWRKAYSKGEFLSLNVKPAQQKPPKTEDDPAF